MSAPRIDPAAPAAPAPAPKARGGASWGSRSFGRDNIRLKLVGALRGEGLLVVADRTIPTTYELDVYARGATHTATGHLEGDFSGFADAEGEAPTATLSLVGGAKVEIDLIDLEADMADFETRGTVPASLIASLHA